MDAEQFIYNASVQLDKASVRQTLPEMHQAQGFYAIAGAILALAAVLLEGVRNNGR